MTIFHCLSALAAALALAGEHASFTGDLKCDGLKKACRLVFEKGSLSEKTYSLYSGASEDPYYAKQLDGSYVKVTGLLTSGDRIAVFGIQLAMPDYKVLNRGNGSSR